MAKKSKERKKKLNSQQRKQQAAQRRKQRRKQQIEETRKYIKKYAVRDDMPKIVHADDRSLSEAQRNSELGWYNLHMQTRAFNAEYGQACREHEAGWFTLPDGRRYFCFDTETIEWSNKHFGNFDEDDMISVPSDTVSDGTPDGTVGTAVGTA